MTTIRDYAAIHGIQPHEIAALLDLGAAYTDDQELEAWQVDVLDGTDETGVYTPPLTTAQAAEVAGVAESTWRAYVARGQAPAADGRIDGRTPIWRPETVEAWLAARPGRGGRTPRGTEPAGDTEDYLAALATASPRLADHARVAADLEVHAIPARYLPRGVADHAGRTLSATQGTWTHHTMRGERPEGATIITADDAWEDGALRQTWLLAGPISDAETQAALTILAAGATLTLTDEQEL